MCKGVKTFYKNCNHNQIDQIDQTLTFYRDVAEEIRKQIVCLLENSKYKNEYSNKSENGKYRYVYTDINLENIFYRCIQNEKNENTIRIFLGDLRSADPEAVNSYINNNNRYNKYTFLPFEYSYSQSSDIYFGLTFKSDQSKKLFLSWMIGILLLSFIDGNINIYRKNINQVTDEDHNKNYKKLEKTYGKKLAEYLNSDPEKRPDINSSLPEINTSLKGEREFFRENK